MADRSSIEWTDATWNPIRARNRKTGKIGWHCEHATTGCINCYAEGFNKRLGTGLDFKPGHRKDIELFLDEEMLTQPLRWKKPRMIFVCSMTDLFADFVPDEWIDKVFAVMALSPQHMFQVLTKRAERMRKWFADADRADRVGLAMLTLVERIPYGHRRVPWPLPNIWLGVSAERQKEADERIPLLLQTPARVRFISAEPLIAPLDLTSVRQQLAAESFMTFNALHEKDSLNLGTSRPRLNWVIAGGESGSDARPMHPVWARMLRNQCEAFGVPYFFKQWGAWRPAKLETCAGAVYSGFLPMQGGKVDRYPVASEYLESNGAAFVERVGKKAAGRLLDGVEHNGFPKTTENLHGV